MMKLKRISALLGVVLLVGLFILAIILAVTGAPKNYLMATVFSMVFIPVIMFSMGLMARVLKPSEPPEFMEDGEGASGKGYKGAGNEITGNETAGNGNDAVGNGNDAAGNEITGNETAGNETTGNNAMGNETAGTKTAGQKPTRA